MSAASSTTSSSSAQAGRPDPRLGDGLQGARQARVVDVKLKRGVDNPQLVFEAMNSTGRKLSQADLIRNYVLMDLPPKEQEKLYTAYWRPMELEFAGARTASSTSSSATTSPSRPARSRGSTTSTKPSRPRGRL